MNAIRINRRSLVNRRDLSRQEFEMASEHLLQVMRDLRATDPASVERYRAAVEREEVAKEWFLLEQGE